MSNAPKLVGLCGKKQSGKDTFAAFGMDICDIHGVASAKIAFASPLKQFVVDYLGVPQGLPWGSNDDKDVIMGNWGDFFNPEICNNSGSLPGDPVNVRELLQVLGTDVFRNVHESFWVNVFKSRVASGKFDEVRGEGSPAVVFITDMRFGNEVDEVNKMGGMTIKLDRNMFSDEHKSESSVDLIPLESFSKVLTSDDLVSVEAVKLIVEDTLRNELGVINV
jgi:hypothetical protein